MDRQSKDIIGSVHSLTQEAKGFQSYAAQSREEVEDVLLRSPLSWEVLAGRSSTLSRTPGPCIGTPKRADSRLP